jgi:hypothetical protein
VSPREDEGRLRFVAGKVARHVRWARTEGLSRLVEEDRLDPRERVRTAWAKAAWRRRHGVQPGTARPVLVVGLQRSGTNMLTRGLDLAPQVEVRNENDRTVFHRYRLRPDDVLVRTVRGSRHQLVLVKPLCDSHRVADLLDHPGMPGGRALWVFRDPDDRARSEVSKFGSSNLLALQAISSGDLSGWQAQRLPESSVELVRSLEPGSMTPDTAAVLFWVVRNRLWFDLGLDQRPDCLLVGYDAFVDDPQGALGQVCSFIGLPHGPHLHAHVERRDSHRSRPLDIDPRVRELADRTWEDLQVAARAAAARARASLPPVEPPATSGILGA